VRSSVLESLGSFPEHAELIPVLRHALETDDSDAARGQAAAALGSFEKHRGQAVPILAAALDQESFRQLVRGNAIKALAELDPGRAWEPAQRLAKYGAPIDSRPEALDALVTIAKHDRHRHDEVRKILEGYLDDPSYTLREAAYRRLGELGDPAAIPAIERRARLEADGRQQRNGDKAVQKILTSQSKEKEDQALRDRVEQLERETELLKEQVRMAGEKKGGGR
jgi:HEAT repeat protein